MIYSITTMVTANKKKLYPVCLAHAVNGMFYSVGANQHQPKYTHDALQRQFQPRSTIICTLYGEGLIDYCCLKVIIINSLFSTVEGEDT